MKEFDYNLDYKQLDFTDAETRKLYRIGRGEQGVLLVRPYTNDICSHWRFVNEDTARKSAAKYTRCSLNFDGGKILLEWTWRGNSWRWVLREQEGTLIIQADASTLKVVKLDRKK